MWQTFFHNQKDKCMWYLYVKKIRGVMEQLHFQDYFEFRVTDRRNTKSHLMLLLLNTQYNEYIFQILALYVH